MHSSLCKLSLIAALAATPWLAAGPFSAQAQTREVRLERSITVSASGSARAVPDIAHITTGVISDAETARAALTANSAQMRKVVDGLRAAGIDAQDIQTQHFAVHPRYHHPKTGGAPQLVGYQATNSVRVTVRDLGKLGEVLDQVVSLGSNQTGGITFEVSNADKLKDEARRAAMANALRRARLLAGEAGAKVGQVLAIAEEVSGPIHRPAVMARAAMAAESVPVEAGSQSLEARVTVTWALE